MEISYWEILLRLGLAVILGGMVGFERESHNRPAGFRTHILVCTGSALIMMVSAYGFTGQLGSAFQPDPGRIAAQVVTGIGFLGAGTILQQRGSIRGLTTAASIWVVSGIGLATGIGFYLGAVATTLLVLISLLYLGQIDRRLLQKRRIKVLQVKAIDQPGLLSRVTGVISDSKLDIRKAYLKAHEYDSSLEKEVVEIELAVVTPQNFEENMFFSRLSALQGILEIIWQGEDVPVYKIDSDQ